MNTNGYEPNMVLSSKEYKVVGTRPIRHDGADKVTGRALYGADLQLTGLLHGAILRSPHAHARVKSIDTSKAEALPGVKAVVVSTDLPAPGDQVTDIGDGDTPLKYVRDNVLASDKVYYKGHAVAGVAAANVHIAQEAAGLIEVEYEPLPPVLTAPDAMRDDAPILHEDLMTDELGEQTDKVSNVAKHFSVQAGRHRRGFFGGGHDCRAGVRYVDGSPGIHRAAQRHGAVEQR